MPKNPPVRGRRATASRATSRRLSLTSGTISYTFWSTGAQELSPGQLCFATREMPFRLHCSLVGELLGVSTTGCDTSGWRRSNSPCTLRATAAPGAATFPRFSRTASAPPVCVFLSITRLKLRRRRVTGRITPLASEPMAGSIRAAASAASRPSPRCASAGTQCFCGRFAPPTRWQRRG